MTDGSNDVSLLMTSWTSSCMLSPVHRVRPGFVQEVYRDCEVKRHQWRYYIDSLVLVGRKAKQSNREVLVN